MAGISRREFVAGSLATGAALVGAPAGARARVRWLPDKVNVGMVGTANQAGWNMGELAALSSVNIVALCDVDDNYLAAAKQRFPAAKAYNDYRKMLDHPQGLDAVLVGTPDHNHAPATLMALEAGLHVYCEKPLTHTVAEARKVAETAARMKRVTQIGTQIHAGANYRRVVELVRSGAIGTVREVHTWCGRVSPFHQRPTDTPPVPANLHYDEWLGPAQPRPYSPEYVPFNWRWWWAFGGGTLGDMGCHHIDLPFWALDLKYPTNVVAEGVPPDAEATPQNLTVHYEFPARGDQPAVKLTWYHGENRPPMLPDDQRPAYGDGNLFIGEKGMLIADYGRHQLLPEKDFAGFKPPDPTIPNSIGHHAEWIEAIKTGGTTTCHFGYSGPLTETVLLGNVSYRVRQRLDWDAKRLRAKGCKEADALIEPHYRAGWKF